MPRLARATDAAVARRRHLRGAARPARRAGAELAGRAEALNAAPAGGLRRRRAAPGRHRADPHRAQLRAARHRAGRRAAAVRLQRLHRAEARDRRRDVFACTGSAATATAFRFDDGRPGELPGLLRRRAVRARLRRALPLLPETRLLQLRREGRLLAVFQTGPRTEDIRVLRWRLDPDGSVRYLDNRGERDHVFPPSHDFEWTATTRDDHVARPPPAHLDRWTRCSSRRSAATSRQGREQHRDRRGHLQRAGRRAAAEPGDADVAVRPGRPADPAARSGRTRRRSGGTWSSTPAPGSGPPRRHRPGLPAAARGPGHHLPGRLLPDHRRGEDVRHRRQRPGVRAGDPLAQRRGRAVRLPRPRRGPVAAAAVQRDPQGGRRTRSPATATRCSTTARWSSSGRPRTSRRGSTRCRCGRRRTSRTRTPPRSRLGTGPLERIGNADLVRGISDCLSRGPDGRAR